MITTPIFTRIMSTGEYGAYGAFNSWYNIIYIIITLSISTGVYAQGLVKFEEERAIFSSSLQGLTTILVIIWSIIYIFFREFWNNLFELTTVQMLALIVLVWTSAVFNFWANEQRVTFTYKKLVFITVLVSIAKPVLGIILIKNSHDKVTARILSVAIIELTGYSWMYIVQVKKGGKFFSPKFWKYAMLFNIPLVPHYLSQTVLSSADRIMIRDMIGTDEAGIYNLAYSLSSIMTLFNTALSQTIGPWIYQKIKRNTGQEIAPVAYLSLGIVAGVNLLLILLAPEAVSIFAPETYHEAIWVIPPVAMSVFFMFCYDIFAKYEFYFEKTKFIMMASLAGALLNICLNYFFIQKYGYIAAGYTTLICYILYSLGHYVFMKQICKKFCEKEYPFKGIIILFISLLFVFFGFVFMCTYNYPLIRYGLLVILFLLLIVFRGKLRGMIKTIMMIRKKKPI